MGEIGRLWKIPGFTVPKVSSWNNGEQFESNLRAAEAWVSKFSIRQQDDVFRMHNAPKTTNENDTKQSFHDILCKFGTFGTFGSFGR